MLSIFFSSYFPSNFLGCNWYADMPANMGGSRGGVGGELWRRVCAKRGRRVHGDNPEGKKNGREWRTSGMQQLQDWGARKGGDHHWQPHLQEEEAPLSLEDQAFFRLSNEFNERTQKGEWGSLFFFLKFNFWLIFFVGSYIYIYIYIQVYV